MERREIWSRIYRSLWRIGMAGILIAFAYFQLGPSVAQERVAEESSPTAAEAEAEESGEAPSAEAPAEAPAAADAVAATPSSGEEGGSNSDEGASTLLTVEQQANLITAGEKLLRILGDEAHLTAEPFELEAAALNGSAAHLAPSLSTAVFGDAGAKTRDRLRKQGFLPLRTVNWTGGWSTYEIPEGAKTDPSASFARAGVVTLTDGRERGLRLLSDAEGRLVDFARPVWTDTPLKETLSALISAARSGGIEQLQGHLSADAIESYENLNGVLTHLQGALAGTTGEADFESGRGVEVEGGFRLEFELATENGGSIPFYAIFLEESMGLRLLDLRSKISLYTRFTEGRLNALDITALVLLFAFLLGFLYIIWIYIKGLQGSPYELYLLFFTKVTEYSAYGAANLAFMFYLREDLGFTDITAGSYMAAWSISMTFIMMAVGAVCDALGVKKTLIIGAVALMLSRSVMPLTNDVWMATILGFVPLAFGIAITGPVLSVGIKYFTTKEGAALGFGLFYTLMNVGWAIGAWLFDHVRSLIGDTGAVAFMGNNLSVYQVIIGIGFFINLPDFVAILLMRDGVKMTEEGVVLPPKKEQGEGSWLDRFFAATAKASRDTVEIFRSNFVERAFWIFILLIGMSVFVRLVFYHFHYTWPTYGVRYLGQGALVGNIYGVLNPVMVVFLVPVFAAVTRKYSSYWMLLIGTAISVLSMLFVVLPPESFSFLESSWLGEIVYDRWLEIPAGRRDPFYIAMVFFVFFFTIGESIWSPRLMQFTAELAPPGREGSYVALAYLPYFGAKFIAGPMAGILLTTYTPEFGIDGVHQNYPDHQMIWWWIGGMAAITPLGMLALRRLYFAAEARSADAELTQD